MVAVCSAVLLLQSSPTAAADLAKRPNIVFIIADDLGWADLSCYGSKFHKTPNLDRLAAGGLRFTDAYAACPVCSPTRAALMTGKHPARLHLTDWLPGRPDRPDQRLLRPAFRQELPLEETTLAEVLKAAGYTTGHVGKWHLGGEGFGPRQQGFDVNIAGDHTGTARSYIAPFRNKVGVIPGLENAPDGEYLTDRLTAEAEKFVAANADRPFFLYLAHYAPHTPLKAKPEIVAKYPNKQIPGTQSNPVYAAMLESLDDSVGRIIRKLEELKLTDRTIVIFTSDNGGLATLEGMPAPATINTPLREGKGYLYEGGLRVPLIVSVPGVTKPGATTHRPVSTQDWFPTLCDLCGVKPPAGLDGVNIAPVLAGKTDPAHDALFWHYPHYANQGSRPGGAVREGDWKLIEFYETGRRELFDLKSDFRETHNIAADKPDITKRLADRLAVWRKDVGAQMMTPNSGYVPNPQAENGTITLPARTADVHGTQLRYEPLPHKNTLGFWTKADDWAGWEFTVTKPGTFAVEVLQGCGTGQGGSEVAVEVDEQKLSFVVEDTGGFQQFKPRGIGTVTIAKPGRYTLALKPTKKAKAAIMDVRQVTLRPKAE
jgi:arylsulfatase A-like enzyme